MGRLMPNGLRIRLNIPGFNEFRNSQAVTEALEEHGERIAAAAAAQTRFHVDEGDPFKVDTVHNRSRAVVFVATANLNGILAEVHDRTLSKAVG